MKSKFVLTIFTIIMGMHCKSSFGQNITPTSLYNNSTNIRTTDRIPQNYKLKENNTTTITTPNSPTTITDNVEVRVFSSTTIQSEVHISINRNNPDNLVASCNTVFPNTGFSDFN